MKISKDNKYIFIQQGDMCYIQRYTIKTPSESPITFNEQLIIDLAERIMELEDD